MDNDILAKLKRLLAVTPEHQLVVPPISRRTLTATIIEISTLRKRVAELQSQLNTPGHRGQD